MTLTGNSQVVFDHLLLHSLDLYANMSVPSSDGIGIANLPNQASAI